LGDLALIKAIKEIKALPVATTKEEMIRVGSPWKPYRSIATMILWHYYLSKRGITLLH
jgi:DNA-3-methyladenine glycosylase II